MRIKKKRKWTGFSHALELIELESREVEQSLFQGKLPWKDEKQQKNDVSKLPRNT
jgi:hypothetical protein